MNARMCDGNKAPHGLSRETLTLMGCVRLCYVPTFFFFFWQGCGDRGYEIVKWNLVCAKPPS